MGTDIELTRGGKWTDLRDNAMEKDSASPEGESEDEAGECQSESRRRKQSVGGGTG